MIDKLQVLWPSLLSGTLMLLKIFSLTIVFSLPLGLFISFGKMVKVTKKGNPVATFFKTVIRCAAEIYIWVFRGTPLLLQLFFFVYGVPLLVMPFWPEFGRQFSRINCAIFTFILNYAAYFAEIFRAGIESIDKGQHEAAKSLSFKPFQTMRYIIIPQAVKRVIPPIANETITLVKDTALCTAVAVPELMKAVTDYVNAESDPSVYFFAAAIYLSLTLVLTFAANAVEKRFSKHEAEEKAR